MEDKSQYNFLKYAGEVQLPLTVAEELTQRMCLSSSVDQDRKAELHMHLMQGCKRFFYVFFKFFLSTDIFFSVCVPTEYPE